jgi:hypothetical protein
METIKSLIWDKNFASNLVAESFGLVVGLLITLYIINRLTAWQQLKAQAPALILSIGHLPEEFFRWSCETMDLYCDELEIPENANRVSPLKQGRYLAQWLTFVDWGTEPWGKLLPNLSTVVPFYENKRGIAVEVASRVVETLESSQIFILSYPMIVELREVLVRLCSPERLERFEEIKNRWSDKKIGDADMASAIAQELSEFLFVAKLLNELKTSALLLYHSNFWSCLRPRWKQPQISRDSQILLNTLERP